MSKEKYYRTLFVYAKDGVVQCLSPSQAAVTTISDKGWKHIATIDPATWIASLCNGNIDPNDIVLNAGRK